MRVSVFPGEYQVLHSDFAPWNILFDGDECTAGDVCTTGSICEGSAAVNCDDANECTDDLCDIFNGCLNTLNTVACDDADPCTYNDACKDGVCEGKDEDTEAWGRVQRGALDEVLDRAPSEGELPLTSALQTGGLLSGYGEGF